MTHDEIMAMDEDALRLEVARAHSETEVKWCDHDIESGATHECEGFFERSGWSMDYGIAHGNIFKWPCFVEYPWGEGGEKFFNPVPDYTQDYNAAFTLVEEMRAEKWNVSIEMQTAGIVVTVWNVMQLIDETLKSVTSVEDTLLVAICRAFLMWKAGR